MIGCQRKQRLGRWTALLACLLAASVTPCASAASAEPAPGTGSITGIFVDVSRLHHDPHSNGDTWDYAWAPDDTIYTFSCDGRGYAASGARNLILNKLTGNNWDKLTGSSVNPMEEYGKAGAREPNGSNWKTTGADVIDGVLYAFVANNWYGSQNAYGGDERDPYIRQTVENMSLIKSSDGGRTWVRDAATNYLHPMWTSRKFSTAFFIKYGRNGGATTQDEQDKYVYAISNNGYWNCGSQFYLGRVPRQAIGRLDAADWQFYSNHRWSRNVDDATPLPGFANGQMKETMGSPLWLPSLKKYVTVTWFDPGTSEKWHFPENVTFAFYQADHPWGPWSWIGEKSAGDFIADRKSRIHRWYGPSLSPRFVTDNPDGSVTAILLFSGQTWEDAPDSLYKNNSLPVTFYTRPQAKEVRNINDTEARYSAGWSYQSHRGVGDLGDDLHLTNVPGTSAEFTFRGSGVELLSEKRRGLGRIEIMLDGEFAGTASLNQDPMPLLYQVEVYRNMALPYGTHTLRILNRSPAGTFVVVDGIRAYGLRDFDPRGSYKIINRVTGNTLAIDGTQATTHSSNADLREPLWRILPAGGSSYHIMLRKNGGRLGDAPVDGRAALLPQRSAADDPSSFWEINPVGNGTFMIRNRSTGLALTETLPATSQVTVSQKTYLGQDTQKWAILRVQ